MSVLLDVNLLLAGAWQSHTRHDAALAWLKTLDTVKVCTVVELGFLRVSMSPGFRVSFAAAIHALGDLERRASMTRLAGDIDTSSLPQLTAHSEVTDAYLVELARASGLRLATLDDTLCERRWAEGVAFNPLAGSPVA